MCELQACIGMYIKFVFYVPHFSNPSLSSPSSLSRRYSHAPQLRSPLTRLKECTSSTKGASRVTAEMSTLGGDSC